MIKILCVLGTRPEAIKLAPVIIELKSRSNINVTVCNTGQHDIMIEQVFDFFQITPDYNLGVGQKANSLSELTAILMLELQKVIDDVAPDKIIIHGDTTTSLCGGLVAFYNQIECSHVEAGLRTFNKHAPFPEEINRSITGLVCDKHFAPTEKAKVHLVEQGAPIDSVFVTGNTVIDALLLGLKILGEKSYTPIWSKALRTDSRWILVTQHRRENYLGSGLKTVLQSIKHIADRHPDVEFIFPVHLNPTVKKEVYSQLGNHIRIHLLPPLSYQDFIWTMSKAYLILTDSGGIQEEAPTVNVPFIVTRNTTERPEAIELGAGRLVGTDFNTIIETTENYLKSTTMYDEACSVSNPYGDGLAAKRIVNIIDTKE